MDRIDLLKENQDLKKELEKHKKALDKTCKRLAEIGKKAVMCDHIYCNVDDKFDTSTCRTQCENIEVWKGWSMKDE